MWRNDRSRRSGDPRRRGGRSVGVVVALVGLTVVSPFKPVSAAPVIQPGAEARPGHTPLGPFGGCTLNFVFTDRDEPDSRNVPDDDVKRTYIGTSGRCTYQVGERVATPAGEEFGTVVFRVMTGSEEPVELIDQGPIDDFALIQVDESYVQHVSPIILSVGRAPTGFTTEDATPDGAVVFMYGQGVGVNQTEATRGRTGHLVSDDARHFKARLAPLTFGDAGAPLVHATDGKALGVVSVAGVPSARGTTIERVLVLLREAGFDVTLVTEASV